MAQVCCLLLRGGCRENLALALQGLKNDHLRGLCADCHVRQRSRAGGLRGDNWREDVKIRLLLANVASENANAAGGISGV